MCTSSYFLLEFVVHPDHTITLVLDGDLSRLDPLPAILLRLVVFALELDFDLDATSLVLGLLLFFVTVRHAGCSWHQVFEIDDVIIKLDVGVFSQVKVCLSDDLICFDML